jgi:hypothetical protein
MAVTQLAPPLSLFPDGFKTTGQHPPLYEHIQPFEHFPKEITGPTVWTAAEYRDHPEKWTHRFTPEELDELSRTADEFIRSKIPLTGISKKNFPLPNLSTHLQTLRHDLLNGRGFILFKGLPVNQWGLHKSAVVYMGLGTYLGYFVSQNSRGHVLGHVKDLGEDPSQIDKVRIYRTNARQFFHADDADIVGLLCIARALEGGESDIVSSHTVYNILARERPDVLKTLTQPIWYFDRKGETSKGQDEYIRTSVIYLERGDNPRVYTKYVPFPFSACSVWLDLLMGLQVGSVLCALAGPLLRRGNHPPAVCGAAGSHPGAGGHLPAERAAYGAGGRRYPVSGQFARAACADGVQGPCAPCAEAASDAVVVGNAGG